MKAHGTTYGRWSQGGTRNRPTEMRRGPRVTPYAWRAKAKTEMWVTWAETVGLTTMAKLEGKQSHRG